jgi:hypothetical protein
MGSGIEGHRKIANGTCLSFREKTRYRFAFLDLHYSTQAHISFGTGFQVYQLSQSRTNGFE